MKELKWYGFVNRVLCGGVGYGLEERIFFPTIPKFLFGQDDIYIALGKA